MKINVQSNLYTIVYASVMVILVALGLSITATSLKPLQEANVQKEKQQNILASINVKCKRDQAPQLYKEYIKEAFVVDAEGNVIDGVNAFDVSLEEQNKLPLKERKLPVYVAEKDGKKYYIFPLRGKGLWGPIWGYVALEDDLNTIYGVVFDHKGETPGLGAEIATEHFQKQFAGKKIFDEDGKFVSIAVVKGGAPEGDEHAVDAISGGTITSKGLQAMIKDGLSAYVNFILKQRSN